MTRWFQKFLGRPSSTPEGPVDLLPSDRDEFYQDPYPYYEVLRRDHPFYRSPDGAWVLSRHEDLKAALDHPSLGNRPSRFSTLHPSKKDRFVCASLANHIMPFLDGPAHKEQRRLVARVFQREVKAFHPRLLAMARKAVDQLGDEFEAIHDFAHPFALEMICGILGIPPDPRLREWSGSFFYLFTKIPTSETRDEVDRHLGEFREWMGACFDRSEKPGVLGALAELVKNGALDRRVAVDTMILLFADGLENVDSGIGNAILAFAEHPGQWELVRQEEALVPNAVAEILRFDSPAQYIARTCLEDFEWQGQAFKKDISVILLLASGNRDERVYRDPAQFEVTRSPNPHLSFGHGKHSCLGARLVEQELAAILMALREKRAGFQSVGPVRWQKRTGHRWMKEARFRLMTR